MNSIKMLKQKYNDDEIQNEQIKKLYNIENLLLFLKKSMSKCVLVA